MFFSYILILPPKLHGKKTAVRVPCKTAFRSRMCWWLNSRHFESLTDWLLKDAFLSIDAGFIDTLKNIHLHRHIYTHYSSSCNIHFHSLSPSLFLTHTPVFLSSLKHQHTFYTFFLNKIGKEMYDSTGIKTGHNAREEE